MEMRGNSCPSFFFKWSMNYHKQRDEKKHTVKSEDYLSLGRGQRHLGSRGLEEKKVETEHVIMQLRKCERKHNLVFTRP